MSVAERFVEQMAGALTEAGLPRVASLVFSALLVDDDGRMTSPELSTALAVSPASVSGAVKYLIGVGMVRRERERGSRRDVYVVDDDAWHGSMTRVHQLYAPMLAALGKGLSDLPDGAPARHRIALSRDFLLFVTEEMATLARRWDERRAGGSASL
jgi:predicted transcriptional regulator